MILEGLIQRVEQDFDADRFWEEIIGATEHGLDHGPGIGLPGQDDHRDQLVAVLDFRQQVNPVRIRETEVEQNDLRISCLEVVEGGGGRVHRIDRVPFRHQPFAQHLGRQRVVLDDENPACSGLCGHIHLDCNRH